MLDVGFPELILVAVVGLLVLGPERLPEALRTLGLWLGRMRRSFTSVKAEIEKEIGMDDIRRQLHNEAVMEEMKRIETEVRNLESMPAVPAEKTAVVADKTAVVADKSAVVADKTAVADGTPAETPDVSSEATQEVMPEADAAMTQTAMTKAKPETKPETKTEPSTNDD